MEAIKRLIGRLAGWRPFSFLDRFVPAPIRSRFGWTETPVDMVNQVGNAIGVIVSEKDFRVIHDNSDGPCHVGDTIKWK